MVANGAYTEFNLLKTRKASVSEITEEIEFFPFWYVVTTNFSDVFLLDFCATPMVTQGFRSACVAQPRSSYEILDFQLAQSAEFSASTKC